MLWQNILVNCMQDLNLDKLKITLFASGHLILFGPYQSEKAIIPELIIKCLL